MDYEFPPCESTYCLLCGDENCPFRRVRKEKKNFTFTKCTNCYNCGICEKLSYIEDEDY